ncbi:hypothetical protein DFAR_1800012 [Desulfarculales bacterium]
MAGAWPRQAGWRKARALSLPEPPTQGCRCLSPAPRSETPLQKKRVAIFRFGVINDFFARDYMERGEREKLL